MATKTQATNGISLTLDPKEYEKLWKAQNEKPRTEYLRKAKIELEAYVKKNFAYGGKPVSLTAIFTVETAEHEVARLAAAKAKQEAQAEA